MELKVFSLVLLKSFMVGAFASDPTVEVHHAPVLGDDPYSETLATPMFELHSSNCVTVTKLQAIEVYIRYFCRFLKQSNL